MRTAVLAVVLLVVPLTASEGAARRAGDLFVVGHTGQGLRNLTRSAAHEADPALSPNGRRLAFTRGDGTSSTIWVMNVDGSRARRVTAGIREEYGPQWSPDGRRLAYTAVDYGACFPGADECAVTDAWVVGADGTGERKVVDSAANPRWSPDGTRLLFQSVAPGLFSSGLAVVTVDGAQTSPLAQASLADATDAPPAWSPDGRLIALGRTYGGQASVRVEIVAMDGDRRAIAIGRHPAWSRSGRRLALARSDGIWLARVSGGRPRKVATASTRQRPPRPAWAPRGPRLAFVDDRGLHVVSLSAGRQRLVARPRRCCFDLFGLPPAWSRDGRHLYFAG